MSTSRQLARRAARALLGEFLVAQIPADRDPHGSAVCFDHISDLDLAFLDFWEAKDGQHGAVCSERPIYGDCAECDALSLLRTNREGVSEELHRHLLSIGQFDPFGKMTLPIALMRPSMAV